MVRISMSLPRKLLNEFNEVIDDRGYNSRSKGIRDALNDYIMRYKWMKEMEGEYISVLTVIYNYHSGGVLEKITEIQHSFQEYINAKMQVPVSKDLCLEVTVVKGDIEDVRSLTEQIMNLKGVEHVKLTSTPIEKVKKA